MNLSSQSNFNKKLKKDWKLKLFYDETNEYLVIEY